MVRRLASSGIGTAIACGVVLALAVAGGAAGAPPSKDGIGDPYFPTDGNPGYDVSHYDLDVSYDPSTDLLSGTAIVTATAAKNLSNFTLDLDGLVVSSVKVGGASAASSRSDGEFTVTPAAKIKKGATFVTTVAYSGVPVSLEGAGFLHTDDGALVAGQPHVASSWFPVNDHPADKATYSIRVTVPAGLQAVSNGRLVLQTDQGGSSVWQWEVDAPMASYLATIDIGEFDIHSYEAGGVRYLDAVDPDLTTPYAAHSGDAFAYSGAFDNAYERLARTITVDPGSPELSFWTNRGVERGYDFVIVELAPTGTDDWTTLPDLGGVLGQDAGFAACSDLLGQHPFLEHYLTPADDGSCAPTGTTGEWWAATGASDGWEQWVFDLSAYAGDEVDVAVTYVSDYAVPADGVSVDDVVTPGGVGSTSFENDGDVYDGWTQDWATATAGPAPIGDKIEASLARQPEIIAALSGWFGHYPFADAGAIVDDYSGLGFALETQTRPVYAKEFWSDGQNDGVVVHELAHQWFGDSVAVDRWADIWLNEGFATYAEWLWLEHDGIATTQEAFDFYYNAIWPEDDPFWTVVIGDPGPDAIFDNAVYYRGAMTLHELRRAIGDDAFFSLLQQWVDTHRDGNASIDEFIDLAEEVSGQKLGKLFTAWLYTPSRPDVAEPGLRLFSVERAPKLTVPQDAPRH
ncbi:M1 family metallopeptidase [Microbacterium sp. SS28]|uniref:M1 family metallopeptidase n=1 Tax=Microbacterium sp. SS28 TaxID=2919948 RepID=UPI001FA9D6B6|nr:M1 family metallopeptidase [Microbacterium sp. SS28]